MKHTESEIVNIKTSHNQMWELVVHQVRKAFEAVLGYDKDLAREILAREKMVNRQELVVDQMCENFIALYSPVAIDLRFVISLLKINNNLERIGDFAESIALFVLHSQTKAIDAELLKKLELEKMMKCALQMLEMDREALYKEDTKLASKVLAIDEIIDTINSNAVKTIADYAVAHPENMVEMLQLIAVIRRIERIGDRCSNIAEDVVFYVDAKELRHAQNK